MRLIIRDIVKKKGEDILLAGAGYTFWPGKTYGIIGENDKAKMAFLDSIAFETAYDSGYIVLDCAGKNCMKPEMVGQLLEEPAFPEFLTVREFVKYFVEVNKKSIDKHLPVEEYLTMVELNELPTNRIIKELTFEERMRLQFLCFIISTPPVIIINGIKNIKNVDFLKDIKVYIDKIKENSIVIMALKNQALSVYLCDETLSVEDGYIQGGTNA